MDRPKLAREPTRGLIVSRKKKKSRRQTPDNSIPSPRILPLPPVEMTERIAEESLAKYHELLSAKLHFPFAATHIVQLPSGRFEVSPVEVIRLMPLKDENDAEGIKVEAKFPDGTFEALLTNIKLTDREEGFDLLMCYQDWHEEHVPSHESEVEHDDPLSANEEVADIKTIARRFLKLLVYGAGTGGAAGGIYQAVPYAETVGIIGAWTIGIVGLLLGAILGLSVPTVIRGRWAVVYFSLVGGFVGAFLGLTTGIVLTAYLGAIPGAIVGWLIGKLMKRFQLSGASSWTIAGTIFGSFFYAIYLNSAAVQSGFGLGLLLGGAVAIAAIILFVMMGAFMIRPKLY
jgi:hypothetical protein